MPKTIEDFAQRDDAHPVPDLQRVQRRAYERFVQRDSSPETRDNELGIESLLREVFPIESYDSALRIEYVSYTFGEPQHTELECRELRLTYGYPLRVKLRLHREGTSEVTEEEIYLGDVPAMLGGGEFIVNGSERVIVSQLHRSPGVDFSINSAVGDRPLHGARIIPDRGSWLELEVTKKDVLALKIDKSSKIAATTFLRALSEKFGSTEAILEHFHEVEDVKVEKLRPEHYSAEHIVDFDTGEEICKPGQQFGEKILETVIGSGLKVVRAIRDPGDSLILNTLAEEKLDFLSEVTEHEASLLRIYGRLRPGNPPQVDKARELFHERFFDLDRYRMGRVGRFRINRKFEHDGKHKVPSTELGLTADDFLAILRYLLELRRPTDSTMKPQALVDDIDHLGNRRLRTLDELATDEMRRGFAKLRRTVQERMSAKDPSEALKIADLMNTKSVSSAIEFFFGRSELSQVVDQTNPLSMLVHERRLSALGPGGLNRKRAGFEVRDVHISHYGRICPIETPEGTNIGLIASLGLYAEVDDYGFLQTSYFEVEKGKIKKDGRGRHVVKRLRADEELKRVLAPLGATDKDGALTQEFVVGRENGEVQQISSEAVEFVDVSSRQIVGVSASLIPFLEHDDANRALMGSNMQRQAVPLVKPEVPCVATGMEKVAGGFSGMIVKAKRSGTVTFADATRIVIDNADEYELRKFVGLNEKTSQNQKPVVKKGDKVKSGDIIADGASTVMGELAIGKNVLVAFNTFDGYNFEDAIVINEKLVRDDTFTSIHIEAFEVEVRETKLGKEEFTADIPNVSERMLANLDENGVVRVGTRVGPDDILVGKVSPKSKSELSPEEKLLHAIFGRAGEDVKNDSLKVPAGTEGIVIGARRFSRRSGMSDEQKLDLKKETTAYEEEMNGRSVALFREMVVSVNEATGTEMVDPSTRQKVGASDNPAVILEQIENFKESWIKGSKEAREAALVVHGQFWPRIVAIGREKDRRVKNMARGDDLGPGVLEMVKVYLATKRQLSVGDKMAGRHGNKGVIARIVPEEDMPFLEDGTSVEILLNPLGVPSRMNVGQILEVHLGWAAQVLGYQAVTPVFNGATEDEIFRQIDRANAHVAERVDTFRTTGKDAGHPRELLAHMAADCKVQLCDGRTGEPFQQRTTVGYMYMLKLHHLVDDKIHARSTGPYSLITQQPLGGKARTGGQRFGEMEVWALEAYGAAYVLQELLTVKSDDTDGRQKIYESMVKGTNTLQAGMPVVFDVLCKEIRGLALNIQLEKDGAEPAIPLL
ncbi:MAG: DNA-directed RNA polymerase subunit beta [Planctomycetota bacterium]|nr:DNA-directed RNA polymerase subunit beta [Planctomycetota bacterium]MDA1105023.1 DNA-directed RNA polymerase subunit beta [Planctomycetota bacterium]